MWYEEYGSLYKELDEEERLQISLYETQQDFVNELSLVFIMYTTKITFKGALEFINRPKKEYFKPELKEANIKVFQNDKERLKAAVMVEAVSFCEMIDFVDEPVGLDSTTISYGIKVRIEAYVE